MKIKTIVFTHLTKLKAKRRMFKYDVYRYYVQTLPYINITYEGYHTKMYIYLRRINVFSLVWHKNELVMQRTLGYFYQIFKEYLKGMVDIKLIYIYLRFLKRYLDFVTPDRMKYAVYQLYLKGLYVHYLVFWEYIVKYFSFKYLILLKTYSYGSTKAKKYRRIKRRLRKKIYVGL